MTTLIYTKYLNHKPETFVTKEEFNLFVEAESVDNSLSTLYLNTFSNRFFNVPNDADLNQLSSIDTNYTTATKKLIADVKILMEPIKKIEELMEKAQQIGEGVVKEKFFLWEGKKYGKKNLEQGFNTLMQEREKLFNLTFLDWDKQFCQIHLAIAKNQGKYEYLIDLYRQQKSITLFYQVFNSIQSAIFGKLEKLQQKEEVSFTEISDFSILINEKTRLLITELNELDKTKFIPLPNINTLEELKKAIYGEDNFPSITTKLFENGEFDNLANTLQMIGQHCNRVEQKNMNVILAFQTDLKE